MSSRRIGARPGISVPMLDCIVDISDRAAATDGDHRAAHWLLCRKVLREPPRDAMQMALAFRHVPLTRETVLHVVDGWNDEEASSVATS